MLLKKPNTLNYPIVFWNIAKFFQIVFRYLKHLDRLKVCLNVHLNSCINIFSNLKYDMSTKLQNSKGNFKKILSPLHFVLSSFSDKTFNDKDHVTTTISLKTSAPFNMLSVVLTFTYQRSFLTHLCFKNFLLSGRLSSYSDKV